MRPISLREPATGHAAPITHVAYSPDGAWLSSASYDGSVVLWHTGSGGSELEPVTRIRHRRLVNASSWSPQRLGWLATASADKTVGLWRVDPATGTVEPTGRLARHTDDVNAVAWLPDGDRVVTASEDSTSLLWDARTGRFLGRVTAHSGHCMGIAVSVEGLVLTVGEDGEVFVGDVDRPSSAIRRTFPTSLEGCVWSPDGSRAALAGDDGVVRIVSPQLDLLESVQVSRSAARAVAFATDGSGRLVVGSYDSSVKVLHAGAVESSVGGGRMWPRSLDTFAGRVVVGSFGSSPVLLALDGLATRGDGGPPTHGPNALATDGTRIAVGLDSGMLLRLPREALTGRAETATVLHVSDDPLLSVAATPDGWLTGSYAGSVTRVYDDPSSASTRLDLGAPIPSLAAHRAGALALAGTYGGEVAVLDLRTDLAVTSQTRRHDGAVKSIVWRSEAEAVSGATDGRIRRFDLDRLDAVVWEHGNLVNAVATDRRGLIASASRDRLVRVGTPGSRPFDLLGADESMKAVAVLGEGSHVLVLGGSYDFSCYSWAFELGGPPPDARAGVAVFSADQGISTIVALDATTAVAASWDGTIRGLELVDRCLRVGEAISIDDLVDQASFDAELGDTELAGTGLTGTGLTGSGPTDGRSHRVGA